MRPSWLSETGDEAKHLYCAIEKMFVYMKHIITFTSQGAHFTSTRNHFPLQWKRQIFPQKGSEMKYSEVMCYETEKQETALNLSKHGYSTGNSVEVWTVYPHVVRLPSLPRNSCSRHNKITTVL